jgi:hypothetical protein
MVGVHGLQRETPEDGRDCTEKAYPLATCFGNVGMM